MLQNLWDRNLKKPWWERCHLECSYQVLVRALIRNTPTKTSWPAENAGDHQSLAYSFKPSKCSSLYLDGTNHSTLPSVFIIHVGTLVVMTKGNSYKYIGVLKIYSVC